MRAESVFWPMLAPARICSRAVEDVDLQAALGARLDRLGPGEEALVVGLLRAEHVVELERVLRLRARAAGKAEQDDGCNDPHSILLRIGHSGLRCDSIRTMKRSCPSGLMV
jgi:hypothetical protein